VGHLWHATAFSVAGGSIQEKASNLKFVDKRMRLRLSHLIACSESSEFAQEQRVIPFLCTISFYLFIFAIKSEGTAFAVASLWISSAFF